MLQGTVSPEEQALQAARGQTRGCTAYVNMETGLIEGDEAPLAALVQAGVSRVVVGMQYPLRHLRGKAIARLRRAGLTVDVLGETPCSASSEQTMSALRACLSVNEVLSTFPPFQSIPACPLPLREAFPPLGLCAELRA